MFKCWELEPSSRPDGPALLALMGAARDKAMRTAAVAGISPRDLGAVRFCLFYLYFETSKN